MGFSAILEELRAALEADAALKAFCLLKWKHAPIVKIFYKKRNEVGLDELPIIFLTRPSKRGNKTEKDQTVHIYYGFKQDNREDAGKEAIDYEELIDDALAAYETSQKHCLFIQPENTMTDEGLHHPVYFGVKEVQIEQPI